MAHFKRARLDFKNGDPIAIWFRQPNAFGQALEPVVEKWLLETEKDFSPQSLVNFINTAMPGCAMTDQEMRDLGTDGDGTIKTFNN